MTTSSMSDRLTRALLSLEGLSVGDAFGERFFVNPATVETVIAERALPRGPWPYTDDTQMALSIVSELAQRGRIDQDALARSFAAHYDLFRGYGPSAQRLLVNIRDGGPWRELSHAQFAGQGSHGNGAAMRVAPLGAYFADDVELAKAEAALSAEVTHAHPEGIAGAIAVAVAAALAWRASTQGVHPGVRDFLDEVGYHTPDSEVRQRLRHARDLAPDASVRLAVSALGNGSRVSAQDTVPFALWCAAHRLDNFEEAMWLTVSGLGDRDTTCAIAGGIVALYASTESIPAAWRHAREPLPELPLRSVRG